VLLTGEVGTGKTTVCRCFLEQMPRALQRGLHLQPALTVLELLQSVCEEFGTSMCRPQPQGPCGAPRTSSTRSTAFLLQAHAAGRSCVLIIDEAQNLSADVLEQLRLLTNLETNERKLLQIMLIGQPELRDCAGPPGLEQLAQRVIARYHLQALSPEETAQYIAHRLAVAGLTGPMPFRRAARSSASTGSRAACRGASTCCAAARCWAPTPTGWAA
jgi:general secretion pathway protein A